MSIDEWILLNALVVIALGVLGVGFRRAIKDVEKPVRYVDPIEYVPAVCDEEKRCRVCDARSRRGSCYLKDGLTYYEWYCPRCAK